MRSSFGRHVYFPLRHQSMFMSRMEQSFTLTHKTISVMYRLYYLYLLNTSIAPFCDYIQQLFGLSLNFQDMVFCCFVSLRKGHISELVAVSAGPDKVGIIAGGSADPSFFWSNPSVEASETLRQALAMGADRAIHLKTCTWQNNQF